MSTPLTRKPSTRIRSFGIPEAPTEDSNEASSTVQPSVARRLLGSVASGSWIKGRTSFSASREESARHTSSPSTERAPIPTMMQSSGEIYTTPLPKLTMLVLSIVSHI